MKLLIVLLTVTVYTVAAQGHGPWGINKRAVPSGRRISTTTQRTSTRPHPPSTTRFHGKPAEKPTTRPPVNVGKPKPGPPAQGKRPQGPPGQHAEFGPPNQNGGGFPNQGFGLSPFFPGGFQPGGANGQRPQGRPVQGGEEQGGRPGGLSSFFPGGQRPQGPSQQGGGQGRPGGRPPGPPPGFPFPGGFESDEHDEEQGDKPFPPPFPFPGGPPFGAGHGRPGGRPPHPPPHRPPHGPPFKPHPCKTTGAPTAEPVQTTQAPAVTTGADIPGITVTAEMTTEPAVQTHSEPATTAPPAPEDVPEPDVNVDAIAE